MRIAIASLLAQIIALAGTGGLMSSPGAASVADFVTTQALTGVWSGARFDSGTGENSDEGVKLELTFTGNHVKGLRLAQGNIGEGEFTLSADGTTIDAAAASGGKRQERPASFTADPAQRPDLIVVTRPKS